MAEKIIILQKKYDYIYFINQYKFPIMDLMILTRNWYLANSKIIVEGLELIVEDLKKVINEFTTLQNY